jgi:hypothetical protein
MKKIGIIIGVLLMTSCGMFRPLTDEEKQLEYKLDRLYLKYSYERDSLIIEHYKKN